MRHRRSQALVGGSTDFEATKTGGNVLFRVLRDRGRAQRVARHEARAFAESIGERVADRPWARVPVRGSRGRFSTSCGSAISTSHARAPRGSRRRCRSSIAASGGISISRSRAGKAAPGRDEFRQRVREKLFVGVGGQEPRIAAYTGRGALRSWVRVTSVRMVLDLARRREDPAEGASGPEIFDALPQAGPAPELDHIRRIHGAQLPEAMKAAFESLTARQRNLLRELLQRTRDVMKKRLELSGEALDSLMGDLQSRLHVRVRRLFETGLETEGG